MTVWSHNDCLEECCGSLICIVYLFIFLRNDCYFVVVVPDIRDAGCANTVFVAFLISTLKVVDNSVLNAASSS